jgi:two-component system sensor histidine kinase/response regulator
MDSEVGRFGETDVMLLEPLAASAAIAIDNARLVEALRQHTVALETSNSELDAFAQTVAHDLKGPLANIVGFAEALASDHASLPDDDLRRYLQTIARNGHKMTSIINSLLVLAGARKVEDIALRPLDMASIVGEVQERLAYMIKEHQAEIILPDAWPVALGYEPWVEEVWINYVSNAIKYGGRPPRVELGFDEPASQPIGESANQSAGAPSHIRFWVRDNGPGLSPQDRSRLFAPFTRLDPTRAQGHGLGLSIVQRIVEKLGGDVDVESALNEGSVFSFTLPNGEPIQGKEE